MFSRRGLAWKKLLGGFYLFAPRRDGTPTFGKPIGLEVDPTSDQTIRGFLSKPRRAQTRSVKASNDERGEKKTPYAN